jgi:hypothetical protein
MSNIAMPPPCGVRLSCIESTAPVEVSVVAAPNSAPAASPKRVSLPSMAAPASLMARPAVDISTQVSNETAAAARTTMVASTAPPWCLSFTIRPNAHAIANGITRSRKISNRLVNAFGFSNGWALLAL